MTDKDYIRNSIDILKKVLGDPEEPGSVAWTHNISFPVVRNGITSKEFLAQFMPTGTSRDKTPIYFMILGVNNLIQAQLKIEPSVPNKVQSSRAQQEPERIQSALHLIEPFLQSVFTRPEDRDSDFIKRLSAAKQGKPFPEIPLRIPESTLAQRYTKLITLQTEREVERIRQSIGRS